MSELRRTVAAAIPFVLVAATGCYASHGFGDPPAGGRDAGRDARVGVPVPDGGDPFVDCGRAGRCRVGEVCCIEPADGLTCVPEGEPCPGVTGLCMSNTDCPPGLSCVRDSCGAPGACAPIEAPCPAECPGVCGCDGTTYCNRCEAEQMDADVRSEGPCSTDPELGLCERVCARAKPVCGLTIGGCPDICADDLADCARAARRMVEACANLDECGAVIDCLTAIPCIDTF